MSNIKNNNKYIRAIFSLLILCLSYTISAQKSDSIKEAKVNNFTAAVTIQNKGISTIPNLTLGKPAIAFDLKLGRKLTFEPQFRFALEEAKPWAIVFWWRYRPSIGDKFRLTLSTNYSFSYKDISVFNDTSSSATSSEVIRTTRYLVGALEPNYQLNKYISIGMYLFYNHGIEKYITRNTLMISFRPGISNIPIYKEIVARVVPDLYYLKMDDKDGLYFTTTFSISKKNCPVSISALINKTMESNIPSEYDFLWNVGLTYTFSKKYRETL